MDYPYIGLSEVTPPNVTPPDPYSEPVEITAGDSISFTRKLANYKASDGWSLSYSARSAAGKFDFTSTASGDDHIVSVTAADTLEWPAGTYKIQGYAINTDLRRNTIYNGWLKVNPDLNSADAVDMRSHNRIVLDKIRSVIEGKAGTDVLSSSVEGVSLGHADWDQLIRMEARYAALVAAEDRAAAIAAGKNNGRMVVFKFKR